MDTGGRSRGGGIQTLKSLAHAVTSIPKYALGQYHKFKYEAQQDARIANQTAMRDMQTKQGFMKALNEGAKNQNAANRNHMAVGEPMEDNDFLGSLNRFAEHYEDEINRKNHWGPYRDQQVNGDGGGGGREPRHNWAHTFWQGVRDAVHNVGQGLRNMFHHGAEGVQ